MLFIAGMEEKIKIPFNPLRVQAALSLAKDIPALPAQPQKLFYLQLQIHLSVLTSRENERNQVSNPRTPVPVATAALAMLRRSTGAWLCRGRDFANTPAPSAPEQPPRRGPCGQPGMPCPTVSITQPWHGQRRTQGLGGGRVSADLQEKAEPDLAGTAGHQGASS